MRNTAHDPLERARDLLDAGFWKAAQEKIRAGYVVDFFPYAEELRFCNAFKPSSS